MSEPLAECLSRFTPDASGLNRDALLFAAGRASVRPKRWWIALAAALAACQLLTLVSLWPHTPPLSPEDLSAVSESPEPIVPAGPSDTPLLGAFRQSSLVSGGVWIAPSSDAPLIEPEPPLRVFDLPAVKYLN